MTKQFYTALNYRTRSVAMGYVWSGLHPYKKV